jgi:hypothetical protein
MCLTQWTVPYITADNRSANIGNLQRTTNNEADALLNRRPPQLHVHVSLAGYFVVCAIGVTFTK